MGVKVLGPPILRIHDNADLAVLIVEKLNPRLYKYIKN